MMKLFLKGLFLFALTTTSLASDVCVTLTNSRIQDVTFKASSERMADDPLSVELGLREYWRADTIYDVRGFIRVDLSAMPPGSKISSATFGIWYIDANGGTNVNQLTLGYTLDEFEFNPAGLNYLTYDSVNMWTDGDGAGVDGYDGVHPHALGSVTLDPAVPQRYVTISSNEMVAYLQAQLDAGKAAYLEIAIDDDNGLWQRFNSVDCEDSAKRPYLKIYYAPPTIPGDATLDGVVDVSDLGVLAANYGKDTLVGWEQGDFNGDGVVNVGDLGILAGNYGYNSVNSDFNADYAKVMGQVVTSDNEADNADTNDTIEQEENDSSVSVCSSVGLTLIVGLVIAGVGLSGVGKLKGDKY
jgi:hypothetical protein